jgi:PAS domain S-box-containing protein/putative nucleotidyltransferase with HDIG domain
MGTMPKKPSRGQADKQEELDVICRDTLDSLMEGCQIIGFDWRYRYVNDVAAWHGRRTKEQLLGQTMMEIYPGVENTEMFDKVKKCLEERKPRHIENEFTFPDGSKGWFVLSMEPVPAGALILSWDVTERKKMEEALRESQVMLSAAQRIARIGSWKVDVATRRVTWTDELYRIYGVTRETFNPYMDSFYDVIHPDDRQAMREWEKACLAGKDAGNLEFRVILPNGDVRIVNGRGELQYDNEGKPAIMMGTGQDITEQVRARQAAQISEEKYRTLVENINEVLYMLDNQGKITYISPVVEQLTKYKVADLMGQHFTATVHPDDLPGLLDSYNRLLSGSDETWEFRVKDKDGRIIWVHSSSSLMYKDGQVTGVRALLSDITTRKEMEEKLKKSEALYRLLADNTRDAVWLMDMDLKTTYFSPSMLRNRGFTLAEIESMPLEKQMTQKSVEIVTAAFLEDMGRLRENPEYDLVRTLELELYRKDGSTFWSENTLTLVRDEKGRPVGMLGDGRDITERKQLEKEREEYIAQLRRTVQGAVEALAFAVETRDPYTAGHQQRVAQLAVAIAREMGFAEGKIEAVQIAASLHDIGKIHVPSDILSKPGRLSSEEMNLVKTHAEASYNILSKIDTPWPIASIVRQHHERMDGSGYPQGLSGDDIGQEARILAVADTVEAMVSHRPYRPALGTDRALEEIEKNKGKLYDADVAGACLKLFNEKRFEFK